MRHKNTCLLILIENFGIFVSIKLVEIIQLGLICIQINWLYALIANRDACASFYNDTKVAWRNNNCCVKQNTDSAQPEKKGTILSDLLSVNHFSMLIFQLNRCLLLVVQLDCFSTHPLMVVYIGHQDSHSDFALVDEYRFCQDTFEPFWPTFWPRKFGLYIGQFQI